MIQIGSETFTSQKAAIARCQAIWQQAELGVALRGADARFVMALLERHPEAADKIGSGVEGIAVEVDSFYGHRRFTVYRTDGTWVDFSAYTSIRAVGRSRKQDVRHACRRAIRAQVDRVRESSVATICPVEGVPLDRATAHVDHVAPLTFDALVRAWVEGVGGWDAIDLREPADGIGTVLAPAHLEDWQRYHREHARLRLVSAKANLSTLRRGQP